jgi:hypothetical protein
MNPNIWGRTLVNMKQKPQFLNQTSHSLLRMNRMDQIPFGWFKGQFTGTTYLLKGKNPLVSSFRRKKKPKPTKKNFASLSRSPIFSHFSETLDGTALIRAFGQQQIFISENMSRVNRNMRAYYSNFSSNRCWLWKMFGT